MRCDIFSDGGVIIRRRRREGLIVVEYRPEIQTAMKSICTRKEKEKGGERRWRGIARRQGGVMKSDYGQNNGTSGMTTLRLA